MDLPATIQPMLRKLIALLGSDSQGEVLGAVSAMRRVLTNNGFDFNDLATSLCPKGKNNFRDGWNHEDWWDAVQFCVLHIDQLNSREAKFIHDLTGWVGTPSEKQLDWLRVIAAKVELYRTAASA